MANESPLIFMILLGRQAASAKICREIGLPLSAPSEIWTE
jgi:hypothetical protein